MCVEAGLMQSYVLTKTADNKCRTLRTRKRQRATLSQSTEVCTLTVSVDRGHKRHLNWRVCGVQGTYVSSSTPFSLEVGHAQFLRARNHRSISQRLMQPFSHRNVFVEERNQKGRGVLEFSRKVKRRSDLPAALCATFHSRVGVIIQKRMKSEPSN